MTPQNDSWRGDETRAVYELAIEFFEREVVARNDDWDARQRIDRDVWINAGYAGDLSFGISVHSGIVAHYILEYGSEEQKSAWSLEQGTEICRATSAPSLCWPWRSRRPSPKLRLASVQRAKWLGPEHDRSLSRRECH